MGVHTLLAMPKRLDIRLIAPSGYAEDRAAGQRGIERLQAAGHHILGTDVLDRVSLRFAGSDAERAAEINRLADVGRALPDMVMATCGGYGAVPLLDRLDYTGLRERFGNEHCAFVGHGEFTVLQCALLACSGISSFHGPMLVPDFGAAYLRETTWRQFWHTVLSPRADFEWLCPDTQTDLRASGTLWGGNLSSLCSLTGTGYLPDIEGGILYIEESGEQAYRIERMLYELKLSGVIDRQSAILIGGLGGQRVSEYDNGYDMEHALERFAAVSETPLVRGLHFGHGPDKVTLPFGAPAELRIVDGNALLSARGYSYAGGSGIPS